MKKIISLLLVMFMLLSIPILTSCESIPNEVLNLIPNFVYDWFPDLVRTTVTEEEWNAMLECSNYTLEMGMGLLVDASSRENSCSYITENGCKTVLTYNGNTETSWLAFEDDGVYKVTEEDGKYYGDFYLTQINITLKNEFGELSMADFTYDEESKTYKGVIGGADTVIKFINGRIYYIHIKLEGEGFSLEYLVKDCYKTVVKIPTYTKR